MTLIISVCLLWINSSHGSYRKCAKEDNGGVPAVPHIGPWWSSIKNTVLSPVPPLIHHLKWWNSDPNPFKSHPTTQILTSPAITWTKWCWQDFKCLQLLNSKWHYRIHRIVVIILSIAVLKLKCFSHRVGFKIVIVYIFDSRWLFMPLNDRWSWRRKSLLIGAVFISMHLIPC